MTKLAMSLLEGITPYTTVVGSFSHTWEDWLPSRPTSDRSGPTTACTWIRGTRGISVTVLGVYVTTSICWPPTFAMIFRMWREFAASISHSGARSAPRMSAIGSRLSWKKNQQRRTSCAVASVVARIATCWRPTWRPYESLHKWSNSYSTHKWSNSHCTCGMTRMAPTCNTSRYRSIGRGSVGRTGVWNGTLFSNFKDDSGI